MTKLKLITFDLDDTLWPMEEVIRQAEQVCSDWITERHPEAAHGLTADRIREIRDALIRQQPAYLNSMTALRRDAMKEAFQAVGYSRQEARQIAEDAFAVFHEARNHVSFFPGALDVLATLADSYTLGALSNGNADLKRVGIDHLFHFHHSAESVGRRKPAPDMFQAALDSAGVASHQAMHVGDHPHEDIDAARQHGFHTVWANLVDLSWPVELARPSHQIHNLHELPDLVPLFDD